MTVINGVAQFTGCSIGTPGSGYHLHAAAAPLSLTADSAPFDITAPSSGRVGDVNQDGLVNAVDALCVLRYVANLQPTTACSKTPTLNTDPVWDVHLGGGPISAVDALCILRSVAVLPATAACPSIPIPLPAAASQGRAALPVPTRTPSPSPRR
ncbi:MAG: dockerin type I domain-containing protein [Dehalococcoidia bacterium]